MAIFPILAEFLARSVILSDGFVCIVVYFTSKTPSKAGSLNASLEPPGAILLLITC